MVKEQQTYSVTRSVRVHAAPQRIDGIIADYHHGHPRILPKQFRRLTVEKGGTGAGTVIRFEVRVLGQTQTFRAVVTEPEPGRVLVERNVEPNDSVTTFTVDPTRRSRQRVVGGVRLQPDSARYLGRSGRGMGSAAGGLGAGCESVLSG